MEFIKKGLFEREKTFPLLSSECVKTRLFYEMEENKELLRQMQLIRSAGKPSRQPVHLFVNTPSTNKKLPFGNSNGTIYQPKYKPVPIKELFGQQSEKKKSNKKSNRKTMEPVKAKTQPVPIKDLFKSETKSRVSSRITMYSNNASTHSPIELKQPVQNVRKSLFPQLNTDRTVRRRLIPDTPTLSNANKNTGINEKSKLMTRKSIIPKTIAKKENIIENRRISSVQPTKIRERITPRALNTKRSINSTSRSSLSTKSNSVTNAYEDKCKSVEKPSSRNLEKEFMDTSTENDGKGNKSLVSDNFAIKSCGKRKGANVSMIQEMDETNFEQNESNGSQELSNEHMNFEKSLANIAKNINLCNKVKGNDTCKIPFTRNHLLLLESHLVGSIKSMSAILELVRSMLNVTDEPNKKLPGDVNSIKRNNMEHLIEHSYSLVTADGKKVKDSNEINVEKKLNDRATQTLDRMSEDKELKDKNNVTNVWDKISFVENVNVQDDFNILDHPIALNETVVANDDLVTDNHVRQNTDNVKPRKSVNALIVTPQPKRRSARLASKQAKENNISSIENEDSFVNLEQQLNIIHNKEAQPASLKKYSTPTVKLQEQCDPSLREYMALKSSTKILNTPDFIKLKTKNTLNTPRTNISTCVLKQLHNLYVDSPTQF